MKAIGLDGKVRPWSPRSNPREVPSSLHLAARALLSSLFPTQTIIEEAHLPGTGGLSLDFLLPLRRLAVEVQGGQHYQFIYHFHDSVRDFHAQQQRDRDKREFCRRNRLAWAALPYYSEDVRPALLAQALETGEGGSLPGDTSDS